MNSWRETLENAFTDLGDISGLTVCDAGSEGAAMRILAERIGDGRIIGVNIWPGAYRPIRQKVGNLMHKVALILDDMRHIDYLKDEFFDLVVSYATMASIERVTPDGTLAVLNQFYRILKKNGRILLVEPLSPQEVKPSGVAQHLELRLRTILDGTIPVRRYYNAQEFSEMLHKIGFKEINWRMVSGGERLTKPEATQMIKGTRNEIVEAVRGLQQRDGILQEIAEISKQAKTTGLQSPPYYALLARKT